MDTLLAENRQSWVLDLLSLHSQGVTMHDQIQECTSHVHCLYLKRCGYLDLGPTDLNECGCSLHILPLHSPLLSHPGHQTTPTNSPPHCLYSHSSPLQGQLSCPFLLLKPGLLSSLSPVPPLPRLQLLLLQQMLTQQLVVTVALRDSQLQRLCHHLRTLHSTTIKPLLQGPNTGDSIQ